MSTEHWAIHSNNDQRLALTLRTQTVGKQAVSLSKLKAIIMTTHSTIRHFRKAALCTVFALTAGVAASASAGQATAVPTYTLNFNPAVKAIYIQNVNNHGGWACIQVTAPPRDGTGGFGEVPNGAMVLYGFTYSARGMSTSNCSANSAVANVFLSSYTVNNSNEVYFNIKNNIYITN
ncbi:hypothetical protein [Xanthomonas albilineans]|uniref:hypothetical protein n=1 Tax=Xanthomonas albilineans TaxID=29447 RepID=UPI000A99ACB8|nr:hypothetical protein [Xanthomonas albilineans]